MGNVLVLQVLARMLGRSADMFVVSCIVVAS